MSRATAEAAPRRSAWCWPRSCTAPRSGARSAASSGAPPRCCSPSSTPTRCGARSSEHRIATIAITGDAMAIPLIDALQRARRTTPSSLVAIASTAAVFSPVVKDQLFELLPNLFISEAVGSSEGGFNGMRLVEKGKTRHRRPHQRHARARHDRDRRGPQAGAAGRDRAAGPGRQRPARLLQGPGEDARRRSSRSTASASPCPATSPGSSSTAR